MAPAKKPQEALTDAAPEPLEDEAAWIEALTVAAGRLEEMGYVEVIKDTLSEDMAVRPTPALLSLLTEVYRDHEPASAEEGEECLADSLALQAIDRYGSLTPEELDCVITVGVSAAQVPEKHPTLMTEKGA